MNRAFRIGDRVQRPKTLDLRRKVLLKNFFRTQNIFVHSVTPGGQESFEFSAPNSIEISEVGNVENDPTLQTEDQSIPEIDMDEENVVSAGKDESSTSDLANQNLTAFSFTTMMVALPDDASPTSADSDGTSVHVDEQPLKTESVLPVNDTEKVAQNTQVKVKRKFSLKKPYSFSRRKTKEIPKVTIGRRISKTKLNSVSMKSPKKKKPKRMSFRARLDEMFTSKSNLRSKKCKLELSNQSSSYGGESSNSFFQSKCTFMDLTLKQNSVTLKQNSVDASKSVSVQTDVTNLSSVGSEQDLENQRLRQENKNLKGKLQYLLSLNTLENWGERCDANGLFNSSDNIQVHKKFESNQENKTGFHPNSRLTRSRSVQASSRGNESHIPPKPRHCRRARSVCISRDETFGKSSYRDRRSNSLQPFKPMQSFFYNDGHRKRKVSPTSNNERLFDSKHTYRKRPRNLSTSYDTAV